MEGIDYQIPTFLRIKLKAIEASALAEVFTGHWVSLATKQDLARLETRIEQSEAANKQEFARLEAQIEQRATKADLAMLEARTKEEMGRVEERLEAKIDKSALRLHGEILALSHQMGLLRWMIGVIVAGVASLMLKAFLPLGV